ncbi:hypothetical protein FHW36_102117 [Chitinophaga polysaccharea]|uniref:Outer membrane protein with beta-barrel domain n=1 Tax=Chitinophaga polysaccharea TaxID=1293035 RepID=A0A561PW75_9BACT|nr:hypothetical protein [Chitinophaga polysaccharea]TWF42362.1 hypothetical protein FHW36_102117 [Chitinophaga polysaccharea]
MNNIGRCIIVVLIALAAASPVNAQRKVNLQEQVMLPGTALRFDSLLGIVSRQTGARFSLNTRKFPPGRIVRLGSGARSMAKLLAEIRQYTGIYYTILGEHIIFIDNPPPGAKPVLAHPATKITAKVKAPAPLITPWRQQLHTLPPRYPSLAIPTNFDTAINFFMTDTAWALSKKDSTLGRLHTPADSARQLTVTGGWSWHPGGHWKKETDSSQYIPVTVSGKDTATDKTKPPITDKARTTATGKTSALQSWLQEIFASHYQRPASMKGNGSSERRPFAFLLNAGVSADEMNYVNPTLQLGFPFLYGIGSWSSNFSNSSLRWGAGTSVRLPDDWRLHLQGTTGQLKQSWDTMTLVSTMKVQHLKLALIAEKKLGNHFSLQGGLSFNRMLTRYYDFNGQFQALDKSAMEAMSTYFSLPKPPYTLSDNYGSNGNVKTWIGFQLGIFYNMNLPKRK